METYEIRVAGRVETRRARSLGCGQVRTLEHGDTVLLFAAVDQAALFGVIARVRDAGLELIAVRRVGEGS